MFKELFTESTKLSVGFGKPGEKSDAEGIYALLDNRDIKFTKKINPKSNTVTLTFKSLNDADDAVNALGDYLKRIQ